MLLCQRAFIQRSTYFETRVFKWKEGSSWSWTSWFWIYWSWISWSWTLLILNLMTSVSTHLPFQPSGGFPTQHLDLSNDIREQVTKRWLPWGARATALDWFSLSVTSLWQHRGSLWGGIVKLSVLLVELRATPRTSWHLCWESFSLLPPGQVDSQVSQAGKTLILWAQIRLNSSKSTELDNAISLQGPTTKMSTKRDSFKVDIVDSFCWKLFSFGSFHFLCFVVSLWQSLYERGAGWNERCFPSIKDSLGIAQLGQ